MTFNTIAQYPIKLNKARVGRLASLNRKLNMKIHRHNNGTLSTIRYLADYHLKSPWTPRFRRTAVSKKFIPVNSLKKAPGTTEGRVIYQG